MKIFRNNISLLVLTLIILVAVFFRFYNLNRIPAGLHADEAAQGYNAFSLARTGKDMYGHAWPMLFRANGSYQPPIYTYLSIVPVSIFGNSAFSIRFISALSGSLLTVLTFTFVQLVFASDKKKRDAYALIAAAVIALAPWSVHFSRFSVEANLAVSIFASSLIFFLLSLKRTIFLIPAVILLGLSTHAYYSERVIAVLFLATFVFWFRKIFLKNRKILFLATALFVLTIVPHLFLYTTGALTRRLSQVSYLGDGNPVNMVWEFIKHYFLYFSPSNLFFDSGNNLGRTSPELSVFYNWFFIPFLFGIRFLYKNRKELSSKLFFLLAFISPIPAALTGDLFYPLRTLGFLWVLSLIITLGVFEIWSLIRNKYLRVAVFTCLVFYSVVSLYISYFVLFKYEETNNYSYAYTELIEIVKKYNQSPIWLDYSSRSWGEGVILSYLMKEDPIKIQESLSFQQQTPYYSSEVNTGEVFTFGKVTVKPINWGEICGKMIVVGDSASISPEQIKSHRLNLEFEIGGSGGETVLSGYSTEVSCK